MTKRTGNQTPTSSVILPYEESLGEEAVAIYEVTGRTAREWQSELLKSIMGVSDGLWVHTKFGYEVPRRNGKNEIISIRELWGLCNGEKILHTAHRTSTGHAAWERLGSLLTLSGLKEGKDYKTYKQLGFEHIKLGSGIAYFRTRSSKSGLGEGFDLLVVDEAQEYTTDQENALKYTVSDSLNPQTIFCGTPPTTTSAGTVFSDMRKMTLAGEMDNAGWAEWSVEEECDPHDKDAWYLTNPSLGSGLTERAILDEITGDSVDFNIQRLGLWLKYNVKSALSRNAWDELAVEILPELTGKLYAGVKFGKDGENVALSIAVKTKDGDTFVETIDCCPIREGSAWLLDFLRRAPVDKVIVDGASYQDNFAAEMKDVGLRPPIIPTVKEYVMANTMFVQSIEDGMIRHKDQPSVTQIVGNCSKRSIGSHGGFGFSSLFPDVEVAILDSIILAHWLCRTQKTKTKKQRVIA